MIKKLLIINLISIGTAQADFAGEFAPLNWTTATGVVATVLFHLQEPIQF